MIADTIKSWSASGHTLLQDNSARRLAMGIALGMLIGLIPKDSLLCYLAMLVLVFSTANVLCAIISGFVFNWIGYLIDPLSHKLGGLILTADQLEGTWTYLYDLPFMAWTRFNNTVVMGSFLIGLIIAYPVYQLSFQFFQRYGKRLHRRLQHTWIYRWLVAPPQNIDNTAPIAAATEDV